MLYLDHEIHDIIFFIFRSKLRKFWKTKNEKFITFENIGANASVSMKI